MKRLKAHISRNLYILFTILTLGIGNLLIYIANKPESKLKDMILMFKVKWWL